ncbi:MAG: hypothetical protein KBD24_01135 [Candidatus Pacebacteria bacterium]|nr:hypothetical protein [Candidatus Paceibacterota bacterium]
MLFVKYSRYIRATYFDKERLERYRTLLRNTALGTLTPTWTHWYLLVWYRWPSTLRPDDFVRVVNVTDMIFAGWTDVPYKLEVLTKITDAGSKFGYENHACMPERAANDETLVLEVAEAYVVNYF